MQPYSESRNLKFMFDLQDLRGPKPQVTGCPNSVLGFIQNNNQFSKFAYILKLAELEDKFSQSQFRSTVFLPTDDCIDDGVVENMDQSTAKTLVNFATLHRKIDRELITGTPAQYLMTEYTDLPKLLVTTMRGQTQLNGCAFVKQFDINVGNGMIHIIDQLLIPYVIV